MKSNLEVLDFIRDNADWEARLAQAPYFVTTKWDGEYFILNYSQIESNFNEKIVRECRGIIFRKDEDNYVCVCRAFDKFGNYGESYSDVKDLDWKTARVVEKVDGSIIKMWFDRGEWHISTNKTIDAFKAKVGDYDTTFGDLFVKAVTNFEKLKKDALEAYTYIFELVSPESQVVIPYDLGVYLIGLRNIYTMQEVSPFAICTECMCCSYFIEKMGIKLPKEYPLKDLDSCIDYVSKMSQYEEGFVVVDDNFKRIKIKSPAYLLMARAINNGKTSRADLLAILLDEKIDDFLGYAPRYSKLIDELKFLLNVELEYNNIEWEKIKHLSGDRKKFALEAMKTFCPTFLFQKLKNPELTPLEYLKKIPVKKALELLDNKF